MTVALSTFLAETFYKLNKRMKWYSFCANTFIFVVVSSKIESYWCVYCKHGFPLYNIVKVKLYYHQKLPHLYLFSKRNAMNRLRFQARIEWETLPAQNIRTAVYFKRKQGFICFKSHCRWVQKPQKLRKAHEICSTERKHGTFFK